MRSPSSIIPIIFVIASTVISLSSLRMRGNSDLACSDVHFSLDPAEITETFGLELSSDEVVDAFKNSLLLPEGEYVISPYDRLFRMAGRKFRFDWRLLSALCYYESHFNEDVVSPRGAVGIMQVMPRVAEALGFSRYRLQQPMVNISAASTILKTFGRTIRSLDCATERDRDAFLLVCYNSGSAHLFDAVQLCGFFGDDPSRWENLKEYLVMLNDPDFYGHEVVGAGRFEESSQTVDYVDLVLSKYDGYCSRTKL